MIIKILFSLILQLTELCLELLSEYNNLSLNSYLNLTIIVQVNLL